jgi:hypothetical protein
VSVVGGAPEPAHLRLVRQAEAEAEMADPPETTGAWPGEALWFWSIWGAWADAWSSLLFRRGGRAG